MSRQNHRSSRRLCLESLEGRSMMAGNVLVNVTGGDLIVTGDSQDNQLQIVQAMDNGAPIAGRYVITGSNGTTVNGKPADKAFNVTHDLRIFLGFGADRLTLGDGVSLNNFIVPNDLIISGDQGNDSVILNRISVRDDVTINTGAGQDSVGFLASVGHLPGVDSGWNDVQINTAADVDSVTLLGGYVRRNLTIDTGTGADSVYLQNLGVGANVGIFTGEGDDTVKLAVNVNINNDLNIETFGGLDKVSIDHLVVDRLFAKLGDDADEMTLKNSSGRRATLEGQGGLDSLSESDNNFINPIQLIT